VADVDRLADETVGLGGLLGDGVAPPPVWRNSHRATILGVQLTRLSLKNFKAFKDAEVDLPMTGVALLVGANNAGKNSAPLGNRHRGRGR
jgi:hypothetical protein